MKDNPDCIHRLELDTEIAIRSLCREHGLPATQYFSLSQLNAPHQPRPMSYSRFAQAMAGAPIAEEHVDMLAFSLLTVRQELRRQGAKTLAKDLPRRLIAVLKGLEEDPGVLSKQDITTIRRIIRRAEKRLG